MGRENFPWKIKRDITTDGDIEFRVLRKFKNPSEISIIPDRFVNFSSVLSDEVITIKFSCSPEEIPNFRIEIE